MALGAGSCQAEGQRPCVVCMCVGKNVSVCVKDLTCLRQSSFRLPHSLGSCLAVLVSSAGVLSVGCHQDLGDKGVFALQEGEGRVCVSPRCW